MLQENDEGKEEKKENGKEANLGEKIGKREECVRKKRT